MIPVGGFVLAGGASSRMEADKSALIWQGKSLLQHAVETLQSLCGNATILHGSFVNRGTEVAEGISDRIPSAGPLGGIDAALASTAYPWNLFLPVDMPLLSAPFLQRWLQTLFQEELFAQPGVCVLRVLGKKEPFPLLLHQAFSPQINEALRRGDRKLMYVLSSLSEPHVMDAAALLLQGETERELEHWFMNLNAPAQWAAFLERVNPIEKAASYKEEASKLKVRHV